MIEVSVCSPQLEIAQQWQDLVKYASPNVFMDPAALRAAHATGFARIHVLLAWSKGVGPDRLVGVWALREATIFPHWPAFLSAPPYEYAFISNPVIDSAFVDSVIPAFFDAIARHPNVPKVIRLKALDGQSAVYAAIQKSLTTQGRSNLTLLERDRPFVTRDSGLKLSGSTRKKLRQDWNRLTALGVVEIVDENTLQGAREAFEVFLEMEAASWKGAKGTALRCSEKDTRFARALIGNLAAEQKASVTLLNLDGRPIAAQVLLYCGDTAYTWKIAYDANFGKYSPGALLVDKITEKLFSSVGVNAIDSCSTESGFMGAQWIGRRKTVDLLVDVRPGRSLSFGVVAMGERGYAQARSLRNATRSMSWLSSLRRQSLPGLRGGDPSAKRTA